jgi:hypothetical protein
VKVHPSIELPTGTPTNVLAHFWPVSDWTDTTAEIMEGVAAPQETPVRTTRYVPAGIAP